jgi:nitroreductase
MLMPSLTDIGMSLDDFERLVRARRSVRNFKADPLSEDLLDRLLDAARWAPSGYNLQPTHFFVVSDSAIKPALRTACLNQRQIEEAPATVLFLGDRRAARDNFQEILEAEEAGGGMHPSYRKSLEKVVPLAFHTGPLGLGWLWKATLPALRRLALPTPELPAVHRRFWLAKQVSLSAMVFMLCATAAGLGTCPMEGFDEARVKKVLGIPAHMLVVMVIPVGFPAEDKLVRSRLPLSARVHRNGW